MADNNLIIQFHHPQIQPLIIFIAVPDVDSKVVLLRIQFAIYRCHKKQHLKAVYRSKREVREVLISDDSQDKFLGIIYSETDSLTSTKTPWTAKLELNGRIIDFKIDTGADVTVISEQDYVSKQDGPLRQTN